MFAPNKKRIIVFLILAGVIAASFFAMKGQSQIGDEGYHTERIRNFATANWDLATPTAFPGYHVVMASVVRLTGVDSNDFMRFINLIFGLLAILAFHAAHRAIRPGASPSRTIQFTFNLIIFPFLFLTYTDIFSLMLVLCSVWLLLRQRFVACALAACAATTVRQNNILWLGLFFVVMLWEQRRAFIPWLPLKWRSKAAFKPWSAWIAALIFAAFCAAFIIFMAKNGGAALGDKEAHPFPSFHTGNIFFLLFVAFFLYLPLHLWNVRPVIRGIMRTDFVVPLLLLAMAFYLFTFRNDHGYNQWTDWSFIRNPIMVYFNASITRKLIFFIPVTVTLLSLWKTRLSRGWFLLLYPTTFVFLCLSWLVEPRYYFIPMALFTLFREEQPLHRERIYAWYAVVTGLTTYYFIVQRTLFL